MTLLQENNAQNERDLFFMREALKEAEKAFAKKEVPVGAVLVLENRIIARGHNQVEMLQDATAHAEMLCLSSASASLGNWRLAEAILYSTLEPCPMCGGAIFAARVKRVVWGASDLRLGAGGSWIDLFSIKHPMHQVEVCKGVLAEPAGLLLKDFFKKQRKEGKIEQSCYTQRA